MLKSFLKRKYWKKLHHEIICFLISFFQYLPRKYKRIWTEKVNASNQIMCLIWWDWATTTVITVLSFILEKPEWKMSASWLGMTKKYTRHHNFHFCCYTKIWAAKFTNLKLNVNSKYGMKLIKTELVAFALEKNTNNYQNHSPENMDYKT